MRKEDRKRNSPEYVRGCSKYCGEEPRQFRKELPRRSDYFSSFFGLHFSQVLPSFLASTQHLCLHSLPAALAFSQQVSARARVRLPRRAIAQAIAVNAFMYFPLLLLFFGRSTEPLTCS